MLKHSAIAAYPRRGHCRGHCRGYCRGHCRNGKMQLVCMEFLLAKLIIVSRFNNIRCSNVVAFLNVLSQTHRRVLSSETAGPQF